MKKKIALSLLAVFTAVTFFASCSNDSTEDGGPGQPGQEAPGGDTVGALGLTEQQAALAVPVNDFSLSLFRQAAEASDGKSTLLSAASAAFALAMVGEGADAEVKEELTAALGVKETDGESLGGMLGAVIERSGSVDKRASMAFANCVVMDASYSPTEAFAQRLENIYRAPVLSMQFSQPATLTRINDWAADFTHGLIPSIADELDAEAAMYVLNAIYFKGLWPEPFDKQSTEGRGFHDGKKWKDILMMHRVADSAEYCEQDGAKFLRLPFGDGIFNMTIALPDQRNGLSKLLGTLNAEKLKALPFAKRKTDITLPVFATDVNTDLKPLLGALGIHRIFDPQHAGIQAVSNNNGNGLCVSQMKQKAHLGVDEEGSEGAAVTTVELLTTANREGATSLITSFCANHPFMYFVSERSSGIIYFIGQFCGD